LGVTKTRDRQTEGARSCVCKHLLTNANTQVVLGTDKETGKQYAIKMLDKKFIKKQGKTQYVKTERDILAKCRHPNIIKVGEWRVRVVCAHLELSIQALLTR